MVNTWELAGEFHELTSRAKRGTGSLLEIAGNRGFFVTFVLRNANEIFFPTSSYSHVSSVGHTGPRHGEA
jgi:hypothetical protein